MAKFEEDLFYAVFENGAYEESNSIEGARLSYPYQDKIKCIIWRKFYCCYQSTSGLTTYYWYHWHILGLDGNPATFRIGDFEAIYFEPDIGNWQLMSRRIHIRDCRNDKVYYYRFDGRYASDGIQFIKNDIIPLLNELNKAGS